MKLFKESVLLVVCTLLFLVNWQPASALTVSPVKVEISGDPGQTLNGEMELFNEQSSSKILFSTFENFEPSGETGSPKFIGASDGLATWLATEKNITVAEGQTVKVPYSITIPQNAEPGGYFSAIFWSEQDPGAKQAGEVAIGGKIGVLMLLRVNGEINEAAGISDFAISGSMLKSVLPIGFSYRFKNDGGDRVVPLGDVTVKNTFGLESAKIPANATEGSVLPNSLRKFQTTWGDPKASEDLSFFSSAKSQLADFHFGYYSANLSLKYGATNQVAESALHFFIIPWQLLSLCLGLLIAIVFSFKKYNAWIIAKSKASI